MAPRRTKHMIAEGKRKTAAALSKATLESMKTGKPITTSYSKQMSKVPHQSSLKNLVKSLGVALSTPRKGRTRKYYR